MIARTPQHSSKANLAERELLAESWETLEMICKTAAIALMDKRYYARAAELLSIAEKANSRVSILRNVKGIRRGEDNS